MVQGKPRTPPVLYLILAFVLVAGCGPRSLASDSLEDSRRSQGRSVTSFFNEGKAWFFGVDVRSARLSGPQDFLPMQVMIVTRGSNPDLLTRESFVLEIPGGKLLPLVSYSEFRAGYRRSRADLRIGAEFLENLTTRFSTPPFTWLPMDFYPPKNSPTVPRSRIETRQGQLLYGYLYFRRPDPDEPWPFGLYKLLFRSSASDDTYVVDLYPF